MAVVPQQLLGHHPLVAMACAVCTVLADMVLLAHRARQRVGVGHRRHAHVERGVEHGHVGQLGIGGHAVLDDRGLAVVVEGCQRRHLQDLGEHVLRYQGGIVEVPAALHDAVADALDLDVHRGQALQHAIDGGGMVGEERVLHHLLATELGVAEDTAILADALAIALGEHLAGVGIHELILERGAAGVDDQHVHRGPPLGPLGAAPGLVIR